MNFFLVFLLNSTIVPSIVAKKIGKKLKQIGQNRQIKKVKILVRLRTPTLASLDLPRKYFPKFIYIGKNYS